MFVCVNLSSYLYPTPAQVRIVAHDSNQLDQSGKKRIWRAQEAQPYMAKREPCPVRNNVTQHEAQETGRSMSQLKPRFRRPQTFSKKPPHTKKKARTRLRSSARARLATDCHGLGFSKRGFQGAQGVHRHTSAIQTSGPPGKCPCAFSRCGES